MIEIETEFLLGVGIIVTVTLTLTSASPIGFGLNSKCSKCAAEVDAGNTTTTLINSVSCVQKAKKNRNKDNLMESSNIHIHTQLSALDTLAITDALNVATSFFQPSTTDDG